jgi:hypothetical protein
MCLINETDQTSEIVYIIDVVEIREIVVIDYMTVIAKNFRNRKMEGG